MLQVCVYLKACLSVFPRFLSCSPLLSSVQMVFSWKYQCVGFHWSVRLDEELVGQLGSQTRCAVVTRLDESQHQFRRVFLGMFALDSIHQFISM